MRENRILRGAKEALAIASGKPIPLTVVYLDIENFPVIAAVWDHWETNVVWVEQDTFISSFAVKFENGKTQTFALPDYHGYRKYTEKDDKPLLKDLHKILSTPGIVVCAHNGDAFDIKRINTRLLIHKLPPLPEFPTLDTLKLSRKHFKFGSNRLDNIGRETDEGRKVVTTGKALIRECMNGGTKKSWKLYRRYNAGDVDLLARTYSRMRPYFTPHKPGLRFVK